MPTLINVPITKAGNAPIEVDLDNLPDDMYKLALAEGLKVMLNAKMSKISTAKLEGEALAEAQAAAMAKAEENLAAVLEGKYTKGRATAARDASGAKVPGVVMTEARRLAKAAVKDAIRAAGMKISHVEAKEITAAANELIASDPSFIETAKANLESRAKTPLAIDVTSLVSESPKLVARAEEAKAARKTQLSAKQAGKVAPRKGSEARVH